MSAKEFGGDMPQHYDRELAPVIFAHYAADIAARTAHGAPGDVLEIAAGTGVVTRKLRDLLASEARLTASDVSAPMLDVARAKFGPGERVAFEIADAAALPFDDAGYDAVVCQFGYMFFPDKPKALREAYRALRPGGRYLFSVWDAQQRNPFARLACAEMLRLFPGDPPQFFNTPFSCAEIDPIKEALLDCGFANIVVSVQAWSCDIDAERFARGVVFGTPLSAELAERGGVDPQAVAQAIAKALIRDLGATPTRCPMQAILYEADKPA